MIKLKIIFLSGLILLAVAITTDQINIQNVLVKEALAETEITIYLPDDCDNYGDWNEEDRTCVLNQNLNKGIEVIQNNITLDCDGHNIDGYGTNIGVGLKVSYKSSISVINCNISNFVNGVYFVHSDDNNLINNNISNNIDGIILKLCDSNILTNNIINWNENTGIKHHYSSNNTFFGNTISGSQCNFSLVGNNDAHFINHIDQTNFVDGKPIYYLLDINGGTFDSSTNAGLFYCINCKDIIVKDLTLTKNRDSLLFRNTHSSRIENVTVSENNYGINFMYSMNNIIIDSNILDGGTGMYFYFSDYNTITNSNFSDNYYNGVYLSSSDNNIITDNYTSNNQSGIHLYESNNNVISSNSISDNSHYGISVSSSSNNIISDNTIFNNDYEGILIYSFSYPSLSFLNKIQRNTISGNNYGIHLKRTDSSIIIDNIIFDNNYGIGISQCYYNKVYHNNFIENNYQVYSSLGNDFDNGYPDGGNYWDDYEGGDSDNDGIGDTPYTFFGGQDNYPFMKKNGWEDQKTVPLYTQVISDYPSREGTTDWSSKDYAQGFDYDCGSTIAECGCAITSMVMIGRFYDIDIGINDSDVDPKNINDWLNSKYGYSGPNLYWSKAVEYLGYIDDGEKMARLSFDYFNEPSSSPKIDAYVDNGKPIVARNDIFGHYFVIDGKLNDIYTVKDPYWYNTKTLDDSIADHVQDYNNYFTKANLFSYLETPRKIYASIHIYLASPAELFITDPIGGKLGIDLMGSETYNDILNGSSYTIEGAIISSNNPSDEIHEKKVIYIPNPIDGLYNIQVIGTGDGDYTLTSFIYDNKGESREIIQKGSIVQNDIQEFELDYSIEDVQQVKNYQIIDIDIKPGSEPNSINLESKGVTPEANLSNQIFDAQQDDLNNVLFAGASPLRENIVDVDNDGDLDLMLHFETQLLNLNSTDTEAILTEKLNDKILIKGSDLIKIVGKNNKK